MNSPTYTVAKFLRTGGFHTKSYTQTRNRYRYKTKLTPKVTYSIAESY